MSGFAAVSRWRSSSSSPRVDSVCSCCGYVRRDGGYYRPGEVCLRCETPAQVSARRESIEGAKIRRVISELIHEVRAEGSACRLLAVVVSERARLFAAGVDPDTGDLL